MVEMVRLIFRIYELFYGEPTSPPEDVIKAVIRNILDVSPEVFHLRMKYSNVADRVLDRVVENIYRTAIKVLKGRKELGYIC